MSNFLPRESCPRVRRVQEQGFSLVELLVTMGIVVTLAGSAIIIVNQVLPSMRADSALQLVQSQFLQVHEMAMDQRRNFTVTFQGNNELVVVRQELPSGTTPVADYFLPYGATYQVYGSVPDTPDGLGRTVAVNFVCNATTFSSVVFMADGSIQDGSGNPCNGTVFMGIGSSTVTARAVTVLGIPARIRAYRYSGSSWN